MNEKEITSFEATRLEGRYQAEFSGDLVSKYVLLNKQVNKSFLVRPIEVAGLK